MVIYATQNLHARPQAYDLLALAAKEQWGMSELPELLRSPTGKPGFSGHVHREFNLSHSGALALCALDTAPVGVDIQIVKSWRQTLPARVCAPHELAWLEQQPDFWRSFTVLWALKESRVKQNGQGLRGAISSISVPIPQPETTLYAHDGLWFRLYQGEAWAGAACGLTLPPPDIIWRILPPPVPVKTMQKG